MWATLDNWADRKGGNPRKQGLVLLNPPENREDRRADPKGRPALLSSSNLGFSTSMV